MLEAVQGGKSGLLAHQARIATIANNLANVHTVGFKKARVNFEDLMVREVSHLRSVTSPGQPAQRVGQGAAVARIEQVFSQGDPRETGRTLDVTISGAGFFEVERADGSLAYTRMGSLGMDDRGRLVTQSGLLLSTSVQVPPDAMAVMISERGEVQALVAGEEMPVFIGQIEMANFINPAGLQALGGGLYEVSEASGPAYYALPAENGMGSLRQGFLESSNVDLVEELIELTMAQRAYELNARVIQVADQILATINGLRR